MTDQAAAHPQSLDVLIEADKQRRVLAVTEGIDALLKEHRVAIEPVIEIGAGGVIGGKILFRLLG